MTPSTVLQRARARIADREKWCRGRLGDGRGRCCAEGALREVVLGSPTASVFGNHEWIAVWRLLAKAARRLSPDHGPIDVNDLLGHAAVLEMYDIAILLAMSEEAAP